MDDNRLINVRCTSCGKVTGNLLGKYDRMMYSYSTSLDKIEELRSTMTGDSLLYEISNENIITIEQLESYRSEYLSSLTENSTDEEILLQYDLILNKILGLFTTSKILDELGLTRYCCRMTVMSPTILPGGANMKVGSSIQTIGEQRLYNSSMSSIRSLANSTPTNRMSGLPSHNLSKMRPISTITTPPRSSRIRSIAKR